MSVTYYSVLGLSQNYTFEKLENAYKNKVKGIMDSTTLSDIEKHLLLSSMKKYYDQAYINLARRSYFSTEDLLYPSAHTFSMFRSRLPPFGETMRDVNSFFENMEKDIFPPTESPQSNQNTTVYSSSSSYREKMMPDGSKIVLKETTSNNNGDITRNTNSYRQLSTGATEPIEFENALAQIQNRILK